MEGDRVLTHLAYLSIASIGITGFKFLVGRINSMQVQRARHELTVLEP